MLDATQIKAKCGGTGQREEERGLHVCLLDQGFTTTRWVHMNEDIEPIRRPDERKNAIIVAAVSRWSAWTCL